MFTTFRAATAASVAAAGLLAASCATIAGGPATPAAAPAPAATAPAVAAAGPKVLLVLSSEGRDGGKLRPGFEMDEFAQAYLVLRANGLAVEVASPAGGAVEADRFNPEDDHIRALLADADAPRLLAGTRRTQDVAAGEHAAIFVLGGKGAMFDLPRDVALQRLLAAQHARGGVIAAVCHGPAVLATVTLADGRSLVAGRRVTGFTDEEEKRFGKRWAKEFPFWIETRMREIGARWEEAAPMMPNWVEDGRLITGQNPFSTAGTAEAVVRALGRTPAPRAVFKEEETMRLVQRWLAVAPGTAGDAGRDALRALLKADAARYKTDLVAMLGYHQFEAVSDEPTRRQALSIMELAAPHMPHPQLRLGIARAHAALGNPAAARAVLAALLAEKPDLAEAKQALARLPG